ncbi:MAG: hypothetical protein LBT59_21220, partial [Clostridiales bacterium]|nr:hypothetical protein [Clostridiales bacterium]
QHNARVGENNGKSQEGGQRPLNYVPHWIAPFRILGASVAIGNRLFADCACYCISENSCSLMEKASDALTVLFSSL